MVVAIAHPQETSFVTVNNSESIAYNEAMEIDTERLQPEDEWDKSQLLTDEERVNLSMLPLGSDIHSVLLKKEFYSNVLQTGAQEHLDLWVEDTKFVLSQLKRINSGDFDSNLKGIFDLSKIGVSGHSFGGATARRFCSQEKNCLASINMDGSSFALFEEKIINPHMEFNSDFEANIQYMIREGRIVNNEEYDEILKDLALSLHLASHATIHAATNDLYIFRLKTMSHGDFAATWANLHDYGLGSDALNAIVEKTSLHFFNHYLRSQQYSTASKDLCEQVTLNDALISEFSNRCQ